MLSLKTRGAASALGAAGLGALAHLTALANPFVYDDRVTVLANPSLVDLTNWQFVLVYSRFRPVVNVSYALDRAVWGFEPFGFHLTNLLLHLVNVVLVHRLAWLATRDATRARGAASSPAAGFVAFGTAALFAVHPLLTEAVGYVSGRSEILCATFLLSALVLLRRWLAGDPWPWLAGGLAAFALALGSKEVAGALPFLLLAYDWLCVGGTPAGRRRRLWRLHLPLVAVVLAGGTLRLVTLMAEPTATGFGSPWQNLLTQTTVVARYLGLTLAPVGQSIAHAVPALSSPFDGAVLAAVGLLGLLAGAALAQRRRRPLVALGALWFLLLLAPSSAVPLREPMAEHRVYLASLGLFLVTAVLLAPGVPASPARTSRRVAGVDWRRAVLALLVVALGGATVARHRVWASPISLWADAAAAAPGHWEPHYQLGDALREAGRCADALEAYRVVVQLRPGHRDAFNNLGICLGETRQLEEAREAFGRALAIDPTFARAHTNLGGLALLERDPVAARAAFERALALDAGNVVARLQLAALHERVFDDAGEALRLCREAQAIAPATPGVDACIARNEAKIRDTR